MNEQIVSLFFRLGSGLNASLNPPSEPKDPCLSVGLGNTLQFILLLDSVAVGGALRTKQLRHVGTYLASPWQH